MLSNRRYPAKLKGIKAIDVAEVLCIHPLMLYRWYIETRKGILTEKKDINIDSTTQVELKRQRVLGREHNPQKREHDILTKHLVLIG